MLQNAISRARRVRRDEGGFTLIELLIVIIILGVLAAIVVFSVRGIADRGDKAACETSVRTIDTAFEAYAAKQANPSSVTIASVTLGTLHPEYLHDVPTDIKGTAVSDATTVAEVDAIAC